MSNANKISMLFFLIFLLGILAYVGLINDTLNKKTELELQHDPMEENTQFTLLTFQQ